MIRGVSWGIAGFRFLVDKYFAFAYLFTNGAAGCDAAAVTAAVSSETSIVQRESESRLSLIICLPATISIPSEGGERCDGYSFEACGCVWCVLCGVWVLCGRASASGFLAICLKLTD